MKKSLVAPALRWNRARERGATAVVIALCLTLVLAAAAMSFDIANLALQRQTLRNLTDAAAQAGASYLRDFPSDPQGAQDAALAYLKRDDPTFTADNVTLMCIVPSTVIDKKVAPGNIPGLCNPGPYTANVCNENFCCDEEFCAIYCPITAPKCNGVRVTTHKDVPFYFAPAIGIKQGETGATTSVSCINSCGGNINPMDVAFVLDRTTSLSSNDFSAMKKGVQDALATMTPAYQLVTLGAMHKSTTDSKGCETNLPTTTTSRPADVAAGAGNWMTTNFSSDYLKTSSVLYNNLTCMNQSAQPWGTHLAAPLKAAARTLLYPNANKISLDNIRKTNLPKDAPAVQKVIIMETDGVPEETIGYNGTFGSTTYKWTTAWGSDATRLLLGNSLDPSSRNPGSPGGNAGCSNLLTVAQEAKDAGILVIMVGYGDATKSTQHCDKYNSNNSSIARDVLAQAASPYNGRASKALDDCVAANSDKDNYFCAANGADLAKIFPTIMNQVSTYYTRLVQMPH